LTVAQMSSKREREREREISDQVFLATQAHTRNNERKTIDSHNGAIIPFVIL
jgi:hypothetical protein